jgi:type I restriction enzyme S subunit
VSEVADITSLALPPLPANWHYRTVREIGATGDQAVLTGPFGTNLGRSDFIESGVPLLTIGCLTQSGVDLGKALFVSEAKAEELSRYRLKEGDLLFSRMASVGRAGLVPKWLEGALFNYHIMRLRLDESQIDTCLFINYVRGAPQVRDYLKAVNHGATRDGINTEQLLGLPVAVPPMAEQRGIVAELEKQFSRLDEAVASLQRVKANLKRYKASVLKDAVEGRLVRTEAELARREGRSFETGEQLLRRILETRRVDWAGRGKYEEPPAVETVGLTELPKGWVWASAEQISSFITKGTTPAAEKLLDGAGEVQFLKVYNLTFDGTLNHTYKPAFVSRSTHEGELLRSQVLAGDVLINIVGPPLGQVSVVPATMAEANMNQAIARFRPITPLSTKFVAHALMTESIMTWAIRKAKTTAGQTNITLDLCRRLPIPLPPLAEQERIVAEVDRRLSLILGVQTEVDLNLKRSLVLRGAVLRRVFS